MVGGAKAAENEGDWDPGRDEQKLGILRAFACHSVYLEEFSMWHTSKQFSFPSPHPPPVFARRSCQHSTHCGALTAPVILGVSYSASLVQPCSVGGPGAGDSEQGQPQPLFTPAPPGWPGAHIQCREGARSLHLFTFRVTSHCAGWSRQHPSTAQWSQHLLVPPTPSQPGGFRIRT